ncbi:hypothetical protein NESM_000665000 [Novymonas esmeraldas]|uniref:Ubiquitin-like domain-containing protein n=1 Tax=Novymonas esmeraldas TaxID=1808958 RepID=A0AAW0EUL7_9TRYP
MASGGGAARSDTPAAGVVSVQLTPIVPVRVFDAHGEFFDTEMDIDAPLRSLQLAIENYFKVKPEVQLLLHNRQQVHADRSLRDNGCLLLKGDPYVKLVCVLKRGPVLNLQCEVGPVTYVVACHETATVWEVKRMLCDEMEAQQRRAAAAAVAGTGTDEAALPRRLTFGPERLRLLWRYMELNDRATLHYYRIATNAVLHVMHRRRAAAAPPAGASPPSREPGPHRAAAAPPSPSTAVWWQQQQQQQQPAAAPAASPPLPPAPEEWADAFRLVGGAWRGSATDAAGVPRSSASAPPPPPPLPYAAPSVPPPPPHHHHHDPLTSAEVVTLSLAVRSLEAQLGSLRVEQRQAEQHQQSLSAHQRGSLADAQQRIVELEDTVRRFHALLERAVALIPASS